MRFLGALLAAVLLLAGCAPTDHGVILKTLRAQLADQYHECVPLGWNPVPVAGTYYPGVNVQRDEEGVWLRAMWIAHVSTRNLKRPGVRATAQVLDELTRLHMLQKEHGQGGDLYRLTLRAMPYFYADNHYGNNLSGAPYLCYSSIVPQRVVWDQPVHVERQARGPGDVQVFRAAFEWSATAAPAWANDPIIRAHSVILSPAASPVVATFVRQGDDGWHVERLASAAPPLPRVVDASVWPPLRR